MQTKMQEKRTELGRVVAQRAGILLSIAPAERRLGVRPQTVTAAAPFTGTWKQKKRHMVCLDFLWGIFMGVEKRPNDVGFSLGKISEVCLQPVLKTGQSRGPLSSPLVAHSAAE